MTLHEKLIEIRKTCEYLKKDQQGYQFKYVSSSQALGAVRGKMDEVKVLLIPRVIKWEVRDHQTKKGEHEYFTILDMTFTWVDAENPTDIIECPWIGQGLDSGEKGVGKAVTYSEKYFILKFFNIATDKDDPDASQRKSNGKEKSPDDKPMFQAQLNNIRQLIDRIESLSSFEKTNLYNWLKTNKAKTIEIDGKPVITESSANEIIKNFDTHFFEYTSEASKSIDEDDIPF